MNVEFSNLWITKGNEITINLLSDAICDCNGEDNFLHKLSSIDKRIPDFVKLLQINHQLI